MKNRDIIKMLKHDKPEAKKYLRDILDARTAIESYVGTMDFDQFKKDDKPTSAVIRKLEIIGEIYAATVKRISP